MTAENTQSEKNIRYTLLWSPSDTSLSVTNRWKEEGGRKRVEGRGWMEEGGRKRVEGRGWMEEGGWKKVKSGR